MTSGGTIALANRPVQGDFDIRASFKAIAGLVRRRNAYGTGAVEAKRLEQMVNVAVKVAAGTPPIEYEPQQYRWMACPRRPWHRSRPARRLWHPMAVW